MLVDVIGTCVTRYYDVIATQTCDHDTYLFWYWNSVLYVMAYHLVLLFWCAGIVRKIERNLHMSNPHHRKFMCKVYAVYVTIQMLFALHLYVIHQEEPGTTCKTLGDDVSVYKIILNVILIFLAGMTFVWVIMFIPYLILVFIFRPLVDFNAKRAVKHRYGLALCIQLAMLYFIFVMIWTFDLEKAEIFWAIKHAICLIYVLYTLLYNWFLAMLNFPFSRHLNKNGRKLQDDTVEIPEIKLVNQKY